ncbi:putative Small nuclear RNA protein activation protein 50 [Leptomonas pyrrhocoris]|uniref:Putative Small nuclear RNA protein activation protein 50 n=1 Tax=Leptomonas pyrrhocoris TaxID=157538 RepID=A0A0M9GB93_LEPPY|nr:putative Small nuclear RNA protein activation protein 50 [Leptomonas pyrrhocoris]KPA86576.1 putative Small nuclear RNA protein activation protein 50 [Leptomonas pyrrhocoris]|eukprot:XP_015665015.1 putative Small nuclear RNA protein activation protein 50 [Leptomonas pyrrhocoris]
MHASNKRRRSFRVDPFTFIVPGSHDEASVVPLSSSSLSASAQQIVLPMTLRRIAYEEAATSLEDLRAVNAEPLASMPADAPLEPGTAVRLPVVLGMRGNPYGLSFSLGQTEQQLQDCDALLDSVATTWEGEYGTHSLTALPPRTVCSQTEAILTQVRKEAARQLPEIAAKLQKLGNKDTRLPYLVEVASIKEAEKQLEEAFQRAVAGLETFKSENEKVTRPGPSPLSSNCLAPASLQTRCDSGDDFCVEHTHRWEFTMHGIRSKEPRETWAVLSCQPLTALLDAVDCATVRDPLHTSRNALFFIHGAFYIDDRHRDAHDFQDLSKVICTNDPLQDPLTFEAAEHQGFGRCPVKSAATTTFKELEVKMGEYCLLRHCGGCDHYFYLSHVRSLRGYPRKERAEFPHRVAKVRDQARRCLLCRLFPSTVVVYEDPLSPESPAYYCAVCFDVLHANDTPEEAAQYQRRDAKDFGETYFKAA